MAIVQGYPTAILEHPTQNAFLSVSCLPTTDLLGTAGDGVITLVNNTSLGATMRLIAPAITATAVNDVTISVGDNVTVAAPNGVVVDNGVSADTLALQLGVGPRSDLATTIGGPLTNLITSTQASLIAAINEVASGSAGLGIIVEPDTVPFPVIGNIQAAIDSAIATRTSLDTWLVFFLQANMYYGDIYISEPNILIRGIAEDASFITNGTIVINTTTAAAGINDIVFQTFTLIAPAGVPAIDATSTFPLNLRINNLHVTQIVAAPGGNTIKASSDVYVEASSLICDISGAGDSTSLELSNGGSFTACKFLNDLAETSVEILGNGGSEFLNCTFLGYVNINAPTSANPIRFTGCFFESSTAVLLFSTDYGATLFNCIISTSATVMIDVVGTAMIKYYGIVPSQYDPSTNTSVFLVTQGNETQISPLPVFGGGMDLGPRSTLVATDGTDISWTWRDASTTARDGTVYLASYV